MKGFLSDANSAMTATNQLFENIINFFKEIKVIEKILFLKREDVLHIWTVITEYNDEAKRIAVYQRENLFMQNSINQSYRFDFYLIEPDDVAEILSSGAVLIFDRKSH